MMNLVSKHMFVMVQNPILALLYVLVTIFMT